MNRITKFIINKLDKIFEYARHHCGGVVFVFFCRNRFFFLHLVFWGIGYGRVII